MDFGISGALGARIWRLAAPVLVGAALLIAPPATAAGDPTDGHSHGDEAPAAGNQGGLPTGESSGEQFEAVVELAGTQLTVWIDDWATNAPIAGAAVTATVNGQDLKLIESVAGTYGRTLSAPVATAALVGLAIEADDRADLLEVTVPAPAAGAEDHDDHLDWRSAAIGAAATTGLLIVGGLGLLLARRRPEVALLLLAGGIVGIAAVPAGPLRAAGDPTDGHSHGEDSGGGAVAAQNRPLRLPDGRVFLPKPSQRILGIRTAVAQAGDATGVQRLPGRVVADPARDAQVATTLGGRVAPIGGAFPVLGARVRAGQSLLTVTPALDASAAQASASELRSLDREIAIAEADYRRLQSLDGVVARAEIERSRLNRDGLRKQRSAAAQPVTGAEILRAPVTGTIRRVLAQTGGIAAPGTVLIEIEAPGAARIEVRGTAAMAARPVSGAQAITAGGVVLPLQPAGRSPGVSGGADTLFFRPASGAPLRTGELVSVDLQLAGSAALSGISLPARALTRDGTVPVVFVKETPTRYTPRVVRVQAVAGGAVLVEAGLNPGERVVTEGAALIAQVR